MSGDAVLLVHGLWMNRVVMLYLARQLRERGFAARAVGYYSAMHDLARNARRLAEAIAELDSPRVHLVAHSLGGVVALAALRDRPDERVRRVVLLGSPLAGSASGRSLAARRWGAPLLGTTRALWGDMPRLEIPPGVEAGAIAGVRRLGLGRFIGLDVPAPNDGVVAVEETRHPQLADHLVMPVAHSEMLLSSAVARQAAAFLASGRFAR
ncbi:MAG TPA: alpha/beta fold hydrolase [Burkholderiales bacterium]|nr:alpha/beta fold hydrolase [Burkholderiales bacterium]